MDWYALFVETGKEEIVQKLLRLYFDEHSLYSVIPKRRIPEKKSGRVRHTLKKMFPGYVFIKTNMNDDTFHKIKKIPKCHYLVNNGTYYSKENGTYYSKIDEEEMNPIIKLIGNGEIVDYSRVYVENSRVFVISGPLKGMEGIIKKIDKHKNRAKILLHFMGVERIIDVGIEILSKL
ncbi:antiterminator LoaP [Thermoflavimicrobium dichotomicum]|uniref:Transcription termination/antitermination protein NusG n=1 Tax=Thermoflavimicrobium dichotomicum TaxID=46223 RepID=A0A1I3THF3_9BACL|nr:antiterminator LoaP [Thermoflavimicrobium dichotomicum]SFJ69869.1 transcriptional antiterminator NusG [Thermoflavimicrobium dichotomicum]